jgi:trehalose/maltose hydrolase-like predicted phosphorylase
MVDLQDLHHNSGDGLHMASLAGAWIALVSGFGGLRDHGGVLSFDPALPAGIQRLRFSVRWQHCRLCVTIRHDQVTYEVRDGTTESLILRHAGKDLEVSPGKPVTVALQPRTAPTPHPDQPHGRRPAGMGRVSPAG